MTDEPVVADVIYIDEEACSSNHHKNEPILSKEQEERLEQMFNEGYTLNQILNEMV